MNFVDLGILLFLGLMLLLGLYQGFMRSALSFASLFIAWLLALMLSPLLSNQISAIEGLNSMLIYYTEGAEKISNIELSRLDVSTLDPAQIETILSTAKLPEPIDEHFKQNLIGEVFYDLGIKTVGDYSTQTIVSFATNLLSFVLILFASFFVLSFIITGFDFVARLPVLSHFDGFLGIIVSIPKSFALIYIFFMAVPIILLALPSTGSFSAQYVYDYIDSSFFGSFFSQSNFLLNFIKGN